MTSAQNMGEGSRKIPNLCSKILLTEGEGVKKYKKYWMSDMEAPQAQLSRERMMSTPNAHLPPKKLWAGCSRNV